MDSLEIDLYVVRLSNLSRAVQRPRLEKTLIFQDDSLIDKEPGSGITFPRYETHTLRMIFEKGPLLFGQCR